MAWIPEPGSGGVSSIGDLADVDLSTPPDPGDALVWDPDTEAWVPGEVAAGGDGAYAETIGDNSNTSFQVTHNLGTQDLVVQLWDLTGAKPVEATADADSIEATDANTVTVTFSGPPAADAYRVVVLASGGSSGGGGGGAGWVTDWSYRSNIRSGSAFAWKGNEFTPYVDVELAAIAYYGGLVANATYQAAVVTGTGTPGNVATITKSRTLTLPGTLPNPDGGWLWLDFDPPVVLRAGTTYGLLTGRTDGADTYALPLPYNSSGTEQQVPMPGSGHERSWRIAKANPQVGDPIDLVTDNVTGAGYRFRLL